MKVKRSVIQVRVMQRKLTDDNLFLNLDLELFFYRTERKCPDSYTRCADNVQCVKKLYCGQKLSCNDKSDSEICICQERQWKCSSGQECIPEEKVCQGSADCKDGSDEDEKFCLEWECSSGWWKCANGIQCISQSRVCNGIDTFFHGNCKDRSDEDEAGCSIALKATGNVQTKWNVLQIP